MNTLNKLSISNLFLFNIGNLFPVSIFVKIVANHFMFFLCISISTYLFKIIFRRIIIGSNGPTNFE